jgi:hypothetical protein
MSVSKNVLEGQFSALLESLQPKPEYFKLFGAMVLDCCTSSLAHLWPRSRLASSD